MLRRPRQGDVVDATVAPEAPTRREFGRLMIDPPSREVRRDGVEVHLTRLEFDLLDTLSARPSMVFTRGQLIEQVWGPGWFGDEHVVDVHMKNLRAKIDTSGTVSFVKTVRGVGYRFDRAGGEPPSD
jgi:DNA-binding response OmpR family regulator